MCISNKVPGDGDAEDSVPSTTALAGHSRCLLCWDQLAPDTTWLRPLLLQVFAQILWSPWGNTACCHLHPQSPLYSIFPCFCSTDHCLTWIIILLSLLLIICPHVPKSDFNPDSMKPCVCVCVCVCVYVLVTQLCPTLCDPMDCSLPGSSIRGSFQARILE